MGKNVTKKRKAPKAPERTFLRTRALALLLVVGVGALAGMALFNGNAKPNRDMQWYMKVPPVEVAAPPLGEGYASTASKPAAADASLALAQTEGGAAPAQPDAPAESDVIPEQPEMPAGIVAAELPLEAGADETPETADEPVTDGEPEMSEEPVDGEPETADEAGIVEATRAAGAIGAVAVVTTSGRAESEAAPEPEDEYQAAVQALAEAPGEGQATVEDIPLEADGEQQDAVPGGTVTLTITAAGDCTFGGQDGSKGRRRFIQFAKDYGYDYFFDGVRSIFENDDLTLINLEGPLTTLTKTSRREQFIFRGDPEYVKILTGSSVELCNLANNHSRDYGVDGLKETASVLDAAGVGYCGYSKVYYTTIKGVRVGALGFTWWDVDKKQAAAAVAEARQNCDLLIVSMHWGNEYEYDQCAQQKALGHAIIDAGADLIIGTHPHVFQGIERYKGKYIVYSLGNFCFAGNANPSDKRCLIFQQTFSFTPGLGIVQAGIMDEGINIIPTSISSVSDMNDLRPTVLNAEQGAKLLKSVASHSEGLTFEDTLWMKNNYMVQNGLIAARSDIIAVESDAEAVAEQPEEGSVT